MKKTFLHITVMEVGKEFHRIGYVVLGRNRNNKVWAMNDVSFKTLQEAADFASQLASSGVIPLVVEIGCPPEMAWPNDPPMVVETGDYLEEERLQ